MSFSAKDPIWKYSNPTTVRQRKKRIYGTSVAKSLRRSRVLQKKYSITTPKGKTVSFGQMSYEDFTKHKNQLRRKNYLTRSKGIKGKWKQDKFSPNNLSRKLLW